MDPIYAHPSDQPADAAKLAEANRLLRLVWRHMQALCFEQDCDERGDLIGVCLLKDGHDGPHEFTPHGQIQVRIQKP